jgi:hypothetical protein
MFGIALERVKRAESTKHDDAKLRLGTESRRLHDFRDNQLTVQPPRNVRRIRRNLLYALHVMQSSSARALRLLSVEVVPLSLTGTLLQLAALPLLVVVWADVEET